MSRTGEPAGFICSVACDAAGMKAAMKLAEHFAQAHGLQPANMLRLLVVVEELLANVMTHGEQTGEDRVELAFEQVEGRIELFYRDHAAPFDLPAPERTEDGDGDSEREGGFGWKLVRGFCREVTREGSKTGNCIRLTLDLV
ncbi:MAG: ATP-binding protein [Geminicoccaceae bacterium]